MSFKLLKEMMGDEFEFGAQTPGQGQNQGGNPAANIFSTPQGDHPDVVSFDVPTLIRAMEWAHETCTDDVQLHEFDNIFIKASFDHEGPLTMEDYLAAVKTLTGEEEIDRSVGLSGGDDENNSPEPPNYGGGEPNVMQTN